MVQTYVTTMEALIVYQYVNYWKNDIEFLVHHFQIVTA